MLSMFLVKEAKYDKRSITIWGVTYSVGTLKKLLKWLRSKDPKSFELKGLAYTQPYSATLTKNDKWIYWDQSSYSLRRTITSLERILELCK